MIKPFEMPQSRKWPFLFYTLRSRVIAVLLLSSLVPLALIGGASYYTIASMLDNKVVNGVRSQLEQTAFSLDRELQSLNHVSMQLSFEGGIGKTLNEYLSERDHYKKYNLEQAIRNYINLVSYTNPNVGLVHYYFADTYENAFKANDLKSEIRPGELPKLFSFSGITYHAPHQSLDPSTDSLVLSVDRRIFIPEYGTLHIYVETNETVASHILGAGQSGMNTAYLMSDYQNRIVYSQAEEQFALSTPLVQQLSGKPPIQTGGGYLFAEQTGDWTLAAVLPAADYDRERNSWLRQFAIIALVSLAMALLFATMLWRTVGRPLSGFNKEMRALQFDGLHAPLNYPKIAEFDYVLDRFAEMRKRIWELLLEAGRNEKLKAQLEVEKLMFQINPHFIHNTLDTVRWLARLNAQEEIERLVATLNKVLYYNMGKGGQATVGQEIALLNDYVALQQIRYDFQFEIDIRAEDGLMDVPIPRFILQPLVENALYHGLGDNGKIEVKAALEGGNRLCVEVNDNGTGMSDEEIRQLLGNGPDVRRKSGMGIGIGYVHRMIGAQYGDSASLEIRGTPGKGTSVMLCIPVVKDHEGD